MSLTTPDSNGGTAIVNAVVNAYMSEVVDTERKERIKRLETVQKVYSEKETELRNKRSELEKLAKQLGSGDKGALSLKEQEALRQYAEARAKLSQIQEKLKVIRYALADNALKMTALKNGRLKPASPADVENAVNSDTECIKLQQALAALDNEYSQAMAMVKEKGSLAKSVTDRYRKARKSLEDQLTTRRKKLSEHLKNVKAGDTDSLETEAEVLQQQLARFTQEEQEAANEVKAQKKQTDMIGNSSIEVEMMRVEISELQKSFDAVADERERLQVEQNSPQARISTQLASPPLAPNKSSRLQSSIMAGLFGFMTPVGLLLWWDVRAGGSIRFTIFRGDWGFV